MAHEYGWGHNAERKRLLAELRRKGGAPCPRCGKAMDPQRPALLDVGHVVDVALGGGDGPRRLEHSACNRSAGAAAGNRRRGGAPRADAQHEPSPPPVVKIPGQGRGPQFEHDLNQFGPDEDPSLYPGNWVVGVDP